MKTMYFVIEHMQGYDFDVVRSFDSKRKAIKWAFKRAFKKIKKSEHGYMLPQYDEELWEESFGHVHYSAQVSCVTDADDPYGWVDWRWEIQSVNLA